MTDWKTYFGYASMFLSLCMMFYARDSPASTNILDMLTAIYFLIFSIEFIRWGEQDGKEKK